MKALLCKAFGSASTLVLEDVPGPEIKRTKSSSTCTPQGSTFPTR